MIGLLLLCALQLAAPPHELLELPPTTLLDRPGQAGAVVLGAGEEATTIWLRPRASFREVLPSWNVQVPPGAALVVELQVADGEQEGPWLHVGDWAVGEDVALLPPLAERRTRMDGARVAVDVLEGERSLDRARLRLCALGRGTLRVERLAVVFSDPTRFAAPGRASEGPFGPLGEAPVPVAHGRPLLPRRQGSERPELAARICSPTSVAMVVAELGRPTPTETVARLAHDPAHDIYGNWNRAVQAAASLGVPGHLERIATWERVAELLDRDQRLVISVAAEEGELRGAPYPRTSGHLLVLWGLAEDGRVLVNDPASHALEDVPRAYPPQDLERAWMARGGTTYVFGPRP